MFELNHFRISNDELDQLIDPSGINYLSAKYGASYKESLNIRYNALAYHIIDILTNVAMTTKSDAMFHFRLCEMLLREPFNNPIENIDKCAECSTASLSDDYACELKPAIMLMRNLLLGSELFGDFSEKLQEQAKAVTSSNRTRPSELGLILVGMNYKDNFVSNLSVADVCLREEDKINIKCNYIAWKALCQALTCRVGDSSGKRSKWKIFSDCYIRYRELSTQDITDKILIKVAANVKRSDTSEITMAYIRAINEIMSQMFYDISTKEEYV